MFTNTDIINLKTVIWSKLKFMIIIIIIIFANCMQGIVNHIKLMEIKENLWLRKDLAK